MNLIRRLSHGGSAGNEQLTAIVGSLLLFLLALELATLLDIRPLLTVHAFVGMLLVPVVAVKLGSTGWRMLRYYRRGEEYVRRGPPHPALRMLVGPAIVVSTLALLATGIALLVLDRTNGTVVALHQASFAVWCGATGVHVLAHVWKLPRLLRVRTAGLTLRVAVVATALVSGASLAVATLPAADHLQDRATADAGLDRD